MMRAAVSLLFQPKPGRGGGAATVALLAAAALAPAIARADPPLGSRLGKVEKPSGDLRDDYEALRRAHRLAECMYFKRGADVRGYLSSLSEREQARFRRNLSDSVECARISGNGDSGLIGSAVITSPDVMRGIYAEAALEKIADEDALQPLAAQPSYMRDWFVLTGRDPIVDEMAVCVADQNPAGIRTLIATKPETIEEKAAVQSIASSLGPCLPQNATLKANRQSLRAALAEALYHRATAPALATGQ